MEISEMKQQLVEVALSLYQRGLVVGSAGNMSVLLDDGTFLATPTGSSFGSLSEGDVSHFTKEGTILCGKAPT